MTAWPRPCPVECRGKSTAWSRALGSLLLVLVAALTLVLQSPSAHADVNDASRLGVAPPTGLLATAPPCVTSACAYDAHISTAPPSSQGAGSGVGAPAPFAGVSGYHYDDSADLARMNAPQSAGFLAPQTGGDECDGGVLYHGAGIEAARGIAANGFSVSAAREMGGDGRFYVTERFGDAELFANSNPRYGEPGGEPAVVRADMSVSVEQAVASGLLRPEPLPGAYTVANIPGFEAITRYSVIEL